MTDKQYKEWSMHVCARVCVANGLQNYLDGLRLYCGITKTEIPDNNLSKNDIDIRLSCALLTCLLQDMTYSHDS